MAVFVGALTADLLLGDLRSLKQKRGVVRSLVTGLRRLELAAAETGHHELLRRVELGVAVVSGAPAHAGQRLDAAERWLWSRPEIEVVAMGRWVTAVDDR